jgi:hypothetical protein
LCAAITTNKINTWKPILKSKFAICQSKIENLISEIETLQKIANSLPVEKLTIILKGIAIDDPKIGVSADSSSVIGGALFGAIGLVGTAVESVGSVIAIANVFSGGVGGDGVGAIAAGSDGTAGDDPIKQSIRIVHIAFMEFRGQWVELLNLFDDIVVNCVSKMEESSWSWNLQPWLATEQAGYLERLDKEVKTNIPKRREKLRGSVKQLATNCDSHTQTVKKVEADKEKLRQQKELEKKQKQLEDDKFQQKCRVRCVIYFPSN